MKHILPEEIQAARRMLIRENGKHSYIADVVLALHPVPRPGLGTMAVDMWWRLYYDPAIVTKWSVKQIAGVLYHDALHLAVDHPHRLQGYEPRLANKSADAELNDNILREGMELPETPITPASLGLPEGLFAEEYYEALARTGQAQESAPRQGASAQPGQQDHSDPATGAGQSQAGDGQQEGGEGQGQNADDGSAQQDAASATAPIGGVESGSNPPSTAQGGGQADSAQPSDRGDAPGSKAGDAGGSKPGDGEASIASSSSGQPSASSAQPGASSQPPVGPMGDRSADGATGREPGDGAQTPMPGAGRCGSCATGRPEPWEDGPPGEGTAPGIGLAEGEIIRRKMARKVLEQSRTRGDVPGYLVRWAEEKLRPKVDWRRELAAAVRHAVADVAGACDYSYRRPSRRQGQVGNGKVILPSLRRPVPRVAVVVDTSGSISDGMLSRALAEVAGILKASGQREGIHVLAVDAAVQTCRRVFRPEQVELIGGGGTNMGKGLEAAARLRPRPQVVVVITDGHTPWPDRPPRGMKIIIALTGDGKAPAWAKTIRVEGGSQ